MTKIRINMEGKIIPESLESNEPTHAVICGFWKRVFAMILDGILLGIVGVLIGMAAFDQLAQLGGWGRLVGFCIAIIYFGVFNSVIGKGQTLGKKMMKIHVVDRSGNHISLSKSFLRYAILGIPFFLNGALIPNSVIFSPGGYILSLLVFGFGAAIFYLYIFNRRTRQSLHDLAVGTSVTTVNSSGEAVGSAWKPHLVVTGVLLVIAAGLPVATKGLAKTWEFPELLQVQDSILSSGTVHHTTAQTGKSWGTKNGEKWEKTYFQSVAILKERPTDSESSAREIAQIILTTYPKAMEKDTIAITTTYGYDIGIARAWKSHNVSYTPEEWQQLIAKQKEE
jgi:uncharacterized RDD family membrane protein YckC